MSHSQTSHEMDPVIKQEPLSEDELAQSPLFNPDVNDVNEISHTLGACHIGKRRRSDSSSSEVKREEVRDKRLRGLASYSSSSNTHNSPTTFVEVQSQLPEAAVQYLTLRFDEERLFFENKLMSYFLWDPRRPDRHLLVQWLDAMGITQEWSVLNYFRFREAINRIEVVHMSTTSYTMVDNFTCSMDFIFRIGHIYNITIARIGPNHYAIIPITKNQPQFARHQMSPEQTAVIDAWYPGYWNTEPLTANTAQGWIEDTNRVREIIRKIYFPDEEEYSIYSRQTHGGPRMIYNSQDYISLMGNFMVERGEVVIQ